LEAVRDWMAAQSGTSDLRAILYFDEVFGFFPPHPANPPTKQPLMALNPSALRSPGFRRLIKTIARLAERMV